MGICWSEPPPPARQVPVILQNQPCRGCGTWAKQATIDYCESCLQKNVMKYMGPSAPPQYPNPQYTYAVQQQQQYPLAQTYGYYQQPMYPPQQRQMGTGTAVATGFILGAVLNEMMDPTE